MVYADDYFSARDCFRRGVASLGWDLEPHPIPACGPAGEQLTVDVAVGGDRDAENSLVVSGGLHGVEGMFGSAVQCAFLDRWRTWFPVTAGVRIVFLHALNPYGFCWSRRCDEQNIDPNRNFLLEGDHYRGSHVAYRDIEHWLNPQRPRSSWDLPSLTFILALLRHRADVKAAVAGGQYDYPRGLFYGGAGAATVQKLLIANLVRWLSGSRRVLHLDFHTGLGPWATWKLLADEPLRGEQAVWLRHWFGARVVEGGAEGGIAYPTRGGIGPWCAARFPGVAYNYLCAEFGTYSPLQMLAGLRAENQAHHWGRASHLRAAKRRLKELFCPASRRWRRRVLNHGVWLLRRGVTALTSGQHLSSKRELLLREWQWLGS